MEKEMKVKEYYEDKRFLKELKECGVAECINEQDRVNRIYKLTHLGYEIADNLD